MYRRISFLFICTAMLTACSTKTDKVSVTWEVIENLPSKNGQSHLGLAGPLTGVVDDKLLIAGGANFPDGMPWDGGKKAYPQEAYLYHWDRGKLILQQELALDRSLAYSGNVSVDGVLYVVGGEGEDGAVADVFRLQVENDALQREHLPALPKPLSNGGLVFDRDALYFVGGENAEIVSDKIYKLDLTQAQPQWVEFLSLPYPVTHAVVVGDSEGNLYIAGGRKRNAQAKSDMYDAVWKADLAEATVTQISTLPQPLAAGTGIWLEGQLLIFGGDDASTFHQVEDLIAQASKMEAGAEQDNIVAQKNALQRSHPGFPKAVWALDVSTGSWQQLPDLVGSSPVTTTAVLYDDAIIIPSGEVKAGVRTDQILLGRIDRK